MLSITSSAAMTRVLASPIDDHLRRLFAERTAQLSDFGDLADLAHFIVADGPADDITAIEAAAGHPILTTPSFEFVTDHGGWFEAVTILSDEGFGVELFVPDASWVDPRLLALLRGHATPTEPSINRPIAVVRRPAHDRCAPRESRGAGRENLNS